jgi:uncharacterized membrane protein
LVLLMAGSGVTHLRKPEVYLPIVPRVLGDPEPYVLWSGVAELLAAGLLIVPATRRAGGWLTVAILAAVFPANVQMALDGPRAAGGWFAGSAAMLWLRLPLQPLLVWWAWTFTRPAPEGSGRGSRGAARTAPSG